MKTNLTALVAAGAIAALLVGGTTEASAQRGFGAGLATGLIGGAIIGGAIANSRAYGYPVVVAPYPGYIAYTGYAVALPGPACYGTRMPVYDGYGRVVGWRGAPVAVCP